MPYQLDNPTLGDNIDRTRILAKRLTRKSLQEEKGESGDKEDAERGAGSDIYPY